MHAKKSLGQNFLMNQGVLQKIVTTADISINDVILEIGPGKGALTKKLLERAGKVVAVEKDTELARSLSTSFFKEIESGKLELIQKDILEFENETFFQKKKYKIVANIPYNITGAIFKKFLTAKYKPQSMTLLVQEEVADRIIARDKKESILSLSVKFYGNPKKIFKVLPGSFFPMPKVTSAVIQINDIQSPSNGKNVEVIEEHFFELVRAGFAHKRKKLFGNFREAKLFSSDQQINDFFSKGCVSKDVRAEDLSLEDWRKLAKIML